MGLLATRGMTYAGADERSMDMSRRLAPPLLLDALAAQLGRYAATDFVYQPVML